MKSTVYTFTQRHIVQQKPGLLSEKENENCYELHFEHGLFFSNILHTSLCVYFLNVGMETSLVYFVVLI